jgi:hypothetical protein
MKLRNKVLDAEFCERRGNLLALSTLQGARTIPWSRRPGSVAVVDERKRRAYCDADDAGTFGVSHERRRIESRKRFKGADFEVGEQWRIAGDTLCWDLILTLDPDAKPRSVQVKQLLPYPEPAYGLGVWTAHADFPSTIERLGGLNLQYGEICHGTLTPSLTLYREDLEAGITVTKPFEFRTSRLSFDFMDYRLEGIDLHTSMLALRPGRPARTRLLITAHEPCWRSGLNWLYRKYPAYFDPPNPRVRDLEGGYILAHPRMTDQEFRSMLPHNLRWEELHCAFPWYGDYLPDEKEWRPIDTWDACVAFDQAGGGVVGGEQESLLPADDQPPLTYNVIKDHIATAHKHGVKSLYYWQCAGDASPVIVDKFPDSIARDRNGDQYPSVPGSILMNADAGTSFGQHMRGQISRLFKRLPEIDGIFLDQLCYDAVDYAHDDGITMADNRPAYMLWHGYEEPVRKLAAAVHRRGKVLYANGPHNVEVQKEMDGLMAEGSSWLAEVVKYLCIAKPLIFLAFYHDDPDKAEDMFQRCLLCGASYSLFPHPSKEVQKIIDCYRPLVEKLYGRKWLLEPDPLRLPPGVEGNIFSGETGFILISVVSTKKRFVDNQGLTRNLNLSVKCSAADRVSKAVSLGTHYRGQRSVKMKRVGSWLELIVPEHDAATVIELKVAGPEKAIK